MAIPLLLICMCLQVEVRLANKEEQSLEKDMIYQQVCRLTDRVAAKVNAGKDDTLLLAKKVCSRNFGRLNMLF